jgi:hypothetical protein
MPNWNPATSVLSNGFMAVQVETRHGGRIISLKGAGGELTRPADSASLTLKRVPYKFGLLALQLWQDSYWHNDLCHLEWPLANVSAVTGRVEVTLQGQSVLWPGVNVRRTYCLTDDPWIDVLHTLDPGSTTQPYLPPSFWFSNTMAARGKTYVPGPTGVVDFPRFPQDQSWCHEPTDGWIGWISDQNGLVLITEAEHLRHVRMGHLGFDRVDWIRRQVDTVESAAVRLIPFTGLSRVDGAGDAGVVGVSVTQRGIQVALFPLRTGRADITISAIGPGGTIVYGSVARRVTAGRPMAINVPNQAGVALDHYGWWQGRVQIGISPAAVTTFRVPIPEGFRGDLRSSVPVSAPVAELPRADGAHRQPPRSFQFDALPVPLPSHDLARPVNARLRVLALAPNEAIPSALMLAERFNFDLTLPFVPATASTPTDPNGIRGQCLLYELGDRYDGTYGDEIVDVWTAALDPAKTYDVILMVIGSADPWSLLPQTLQANILGRVQAGTGLVLVNRNAPGGPNPETTTLLNLLPLTIANTSDYRGPWHPENDLTVRGLPWSLMAQPAYIYNYGVQTGATILVQLEYPTLPPTLLPLLARTQYGIGRVLHLAWGPQLLRLDRPVPSGAEGFENSRYDLDFVGRVIFDAANRPPAVAVQNVTLNGTSATVELDQVSTVTPAFDLDWQARDRFGILLGRGRQSFTAFPAGGNVPLTIPTGSWACDLVVTPATGDSGWGAGAQTLDVAFSVLPNLPAYDRWQSIQVAPTLPVGASHALVDLVDGRGRICERVDVLPRAAATLSFSSINTPAAELRVHALNPAGQLVSQGFLAIRVRVRTGFDAWAAHFWNSPLPLPHSLQTRRLDANRSLGVPAYFFLYADPHDELIAAADRLSVPYVVQASAWLYCSGGQTPSGNQGSISLVNTQQTITGQRSDRSLAGSFADLNVLYYRAADDEPDPPRTDVCVAPETLDWFRTWLAPLYGHSDARLQAEWGPGASLATATPDSYAAAVSQFSTTLTYAPWVDHRRFMIHLFSDAPAWARQALREGDPFALLGSSGDNVAGLAEGRDWWVRGRALDVVGRYGTSTRFELAEVKTPSFSWTGYDDPDPIIRYRMAYALGMGDPCLALFAESTLINPDLSLPQVGRDLAAALLPMRRGLAKLFSHSSAAADGVFVMSAPDSYPVLAIHGYESLGAWAVGTVPVQTDLGFQARENIHMLLATMGIGWRVVNPLDVETGALEREGARLLILPMCAALSDAACEAIRRWVEQGGAVIADILPATFSEHGRLRGTGIAANGGLSNSTNPLDQVFGLTPGAKPPITPATITVGTANFNVLCADTSVGSVGTATAGGSVAGGQPAWFTNNYGLGSARYLGCSFFSDYPWGDPAQLVQRRSMEAIFAALLGSVGIVPHGQAMVAGARASAFAYWVRQYGSAELVVLARNFVVIYSPPEPEEDGTVIFNSSAYTYDLDEGTYLGFGDRLDMHMSRHTYRTLARLPYRVLGVAVTAAPSLVLGRSLSTSVQIQTAGQTPGQHMIRIDVVDPDGNAIPYMSREVPIASGLVSIEIPTALNDPVGRWTVIASDLLTGTQGQAQVMCSAGPSPIPVPEVNWIHGIDD